MGILNSAITVISSPRFVNFLPKYDYIVCHNINFDVDKKRRIWKKPDSDRIVIGYIGAVGYKQTLGRWDSFDQINFEQLHIISPIILILLY